jgi:hypothetical protein
MTLFVKHFNLYLPPRWRVLKNSVILFSASKYMLHDMTFFTVEHKKLRIRQNYLYVKM